MDRQDIATCFLLTNRYGVRAWQSTTTKRRRNQCRRRTKSGCLMYLQAYSMSHLESLTDAESLARKEEGSCPFHKLQEPVCYSNFHALSLWITEKASVIIHHSFDSWNGRQNLHAITLELRLKNKRWTVQKKNQNLSALSRYSIYAFVHHSMSRDRIDDCIQCDSLIDEARTTRTEEKAFRLSGTDGYRMPNGNNTCMGCFL